MARARVGSWEWMQQTGGVLSTRDALGEATRGILDQIRHWPRRLAHSLGKTYGEPLEAGDLTIPDTRAAKDATEYVRGITPEFLFNHCERTYFFSYAFAKQARVDFDEETLYLACILHDVGLTDPHKEGGECFTIRSAHKAMELAPKREVCVAEAITMHINTRVDRKDSCIEAWLLANGVALDVVGRRAWDLHPATIESVVARAPRVGFKSNMWRTWKPEADAHPRCRAHFLNRFAGMGRLVHKAPFVE